MSDAISKLGGILAEQMRMQAQKSVPVFAELGTIKAGLGLALDSMGEIVIPKSEYFVDRLLNMQNPMATTEPAGDHTHTAYGGGTGTAGNHTHNINMPTKMQTLKEGDRVLVIWTVSKIPVVTAIIEKMG